MNKIKILVVESNKEPIIKVVKKPLEEITNVINGILEYIPLENNILLICNKYGKQNNLEFNRTIKNDIICGTFAIVEHNLQEIVSLENQKIKKYKKQFKLERDLNMIKFLKCTIKDSENILKYNLNLENIEEKVKILKEEKNI